MKIYLDFEFIEDGKTINPLSIGMVREDDDEYYAEFAEADLSKANDWVWAHVIPNLKSYTPNQPNRLFTNLDLKENNPGFYSLTTDLIKAEILEFAGEKPEFWGYFCDYDWVIMSQLFGAMIELPKGWPMYCLDVKQEMKMHHITKEEIEQEYPQPTTHNSLDDARWIKFAREYVAEHGS